MFVKKAGLEEVVKAIEENGTEVIYLEEGFLKVKEVILDIIVPYIKNPKVTFLNDYKSKLQEALQSDKRSFIYETIDESGPAHERVFTIQVKVDNIIYGKGIASSKKEAAQLAAKEALELLALKGDNYEKE